MLQVSSGTRDSGSALLQVEALKDSVMLEKKIRTLNLSFALMALLLDKYAQHNDKQIGS